MTAPLVDRADVGAFIERYAERLMAGPNPDKVDWRKLFGFRVDQVVTPAMIDAAYKDLARDNHPDKGTTPDEHYGPDGLRGGWFAAPDPYAVWHRRPSIHMPRWASRLTLTVIDVRVQRLHDITEQDSEAEGVTWDCADGFDVWYVPGAGVPNTATARECFAGLWGSLHDAKGERWEDNPKIVAVTFGVTAGNIDGAGR